MKYLINIIIAKSEQYRVCKWFKKRVPHLSNYLIKTIGINRDNEKHEPHRKIKEGKRPAKHMRNSVYHHILRKLKNTLHTKKPVYENEHSY